MMYKISSEIHQFSEVIQNLIIGANGSSKIAADYGVYLMKELRIFNTVRVFDSHELKRGDLERLRFGGYLTLTIYPQFLQNRTIHNSINIFTLSQSGESPALISALKTAKELELTCINVVNVEDSPITKVTDHLRGEDESGRDRNIGFYMKTGYCYCDIKSFIPQVVSMALVALWFSDHKMRKPNKEVKKLRQSLVEDLELLNMRLKQALTEPILTSYKAVGTFLRDHENLFMLGRGTGVFVCSYMAEKFTQVTTIHAEAYPSGEFRHGPLSMIDDKERTPVLFIVNDDEHLTQILGNIGQVRERGATIIVISTVEGLDKLMDVSKIHFLIELLPVKSHFASLQACTALQMIAYFTARARGLNPDQQVFDAIDFNHAFQ